MRRKADKAIWVVLALATAVNIYATARMSKPVARISTVFEALDLSDSCKKIGFVQRQSSRELLEGGIQ